MSRKSYKVYEFTSNTETGHINLVTTSIIMKTWFGQLQLRFTRKFYFWI